MTGGWSLLPRKRDRVTGRFFRACLAELFGTFAVIFWAGACAAHAEVANKALYVAFGSAFAYATAVYLFYDIGGAHFNPAVSLGLFFAQRISFVRFLCYLICQFTGGFLGAGICYGLTYGAAVHIGLNADVKPNVGFCWELLGSILLVFIYLAGTNDLRDRRKSSCDLPVTVGITVFLLNLAMFPRTGCGVSPVRGLVMNVVVDQVYHYQWLYVVAPFVGCLVAALGYQVVFAVQYKTRFYRSSRSSGSGESPKINNITFENPVVVETTNNGKL